MKKVLFVALAIVLGLASCVKDDKYPGLTITNVKYAPTAVSDFNDVTVTATITSFTAVTAELVYNTGDEDKTVAMTNVENLYSAVIPAQPNDTKVIFYVKAENEDMTHTSTPMEYTVGTVQIDYSKLRLNELNGNDKFIEIYNAGDLDLSVEGIYLVKDDGTEPTWTGAAGTVVPAHGYLLLYSEDVVLPGEAQEGYPEELVFHSGLSAKKTIKYALYMPDGTERDVFTRGETGEWGQTISNVAPQSYARITDGGDWKLAEPTPNEANPDNGEEIPQV